MASSPSPEQFHSYNSDINGLDADQQDIAYLMGEYALRWQAQQWAGLRLMIERDHSGRDETRYDPLDFRGQRLGLFASGEQMGWRLLDDYRLELAMLDGDNRYNDGRDQDVRGWACSASWASASTTALAAACTCTAALPTNRTRTATASASMPSSPTG